MKSGFSIDAIRRKHGRLVRAVAVLFLLYTGADIAMPQYFCGEEVGGLPLASFLSDRAARRDDTPTRLASAPEAPRPNDSDSQAPHDDEDCFCCCAHVLPGLRITHELTAEVKVPASPAGVESPSSPPLRSTYRPPRFA